MPFLSAGRYVANVVDGKGTLWRKAEHPKAGPNETEVNFAHPMAKEVGPQDALASRQEVQAQEDEK